MPIVYSNDSALAFRWRSLFMLRSIFTGVPLALLLCVAPVRADDDPEPARSGAEARSGGYVVKLSKAGEVTASDKQGKLIWRYDTRAAADKPGQVVIGGERVVVGHKGVLTALELVSGKALWVKTGSDVAAKMKV